MKDCAITRDRIITTVFEMMGIPFIRIFGDCPVFTALCTDKSANRLLKPESKTKLQKKGVKVQVPMELKAKRTVFMRRLDNVLAKDEIKEEI